MTSSWTTAWTCPFCPLLCTTAGVQPGPRLRPITGASGPCRHAGPGLARFADVPADAQPRIAGRPATLDEAVAHAAALLGASMQPLFGGLGTDVAGARALYPLACATGAICDVAAGTPMFESLRVQQDRGGYTTTLAEVAERADLLLLATPHDDAAPSDTMADLLARCTAGSPEVLQLQQAAGAGADAFDALAWLAALVEGRGAVRARAPQALRVLAERLKAARYAVIVYETSRLPAHGGLLIEALQRVVATLNRSTRAAALGLGGGAGSTAGAYTVNQVFTWLSGLPLRSRAAQGGLEHEPLRFATERLLADGAVDALLWIATFGPLPVPTAAAGLPRIVLGHPDQAAEGDTVFIPVSTPGVGSAGHLFRTDGSVLLPLRPLYADSLPTVATVLQRLHAAFQESTA
ncbi:formylmethanofuran dehydrogenase [Aquincola sp. J276]|uniref:formylmethanofuran dehydrogenase n=1 Tax=Aquincola sp. J276 TaxID=2898432 RepID=UPI0021513027|nr:formylmethanofuran dehydrogenase [Aquincola sp. J276]MCR5868820.1 formylmethanofuran dehydrogenase [Aquincola sp. J276]